MTRPRTLRLLAVTTLLGLPIMALPARAQPAPPSATTDGARHRTHRRRKPAPMVVAPAAAPGAPLKGAPLPPGAKAAAPAPNALPPVEAAAIDCPDRIPPGKKFKWDLRGEVELKDLVTWASATLCKPVILPTTLRQAKVQILAPAAITQPEAYRMFLAALSAMGLTIQPEGNALVIIESNRAKESNVPFLGPDGHMPENASFVTKLMRVQYIPVEDVNNVLNRLKSKDGDIVPYAPTGSLIITDSSENIRRMDEIVKLLDQPTGAEKIWFVKLRNSTAQEMAQILEKLFIPKDKKGPTAATRTPGAPGGGGPVEIEGTETASLIIPDERANLLIIKANEKTYRRMLALIKTLEATSAAPVDVAADRVHVYALANANAEDIGTTLSSLGVGVGGARGRTTTGTPPGGARPTGATGSAQGANTNLFEGDVRVAADKPTNSLIIIAGGKDYYTLRNIIRMLDIPRRQVFIEATILEVSLDKSRKLGAAFHAGGTVGSGDGQSLLFGGLEPNSSVNSLALSPATLTGLAAGLRGPAIPGADTLLGLPAGTSVPAFGVYLQALQNNNDVNVLSMPHILTSDNEKAHIEVGQNLPFPGSLGNSALAGGLGGAAGAGLGALGFGTSVQRQDVSLKLEITPHVNDSDIVRLEIENEISDVAATNYNGLGPATNKRKVKTVVSVRDQQPVVLGGLVRDKISDQQDKVPLLGDIPIIGYLFKYSNKQITKQNLLIILTPYVIKDPQDLRRIFERKVRERREFLERSSAFRDDSDYESAMDYRHRRGLLEEINRTAIDAEKEAHELQIAEERARGRVTEGSIEVNAPMLPAPARAPLMTPGTPAPRGEPKRGGHTPPPPPPPPAAGGDVDAFPGNNDSTPPAPPPVYVEPAQTGGNE